MGPIEAKWNGRQWRVRLRGLHSMRIEGLGKPGRELFGWHVVIDPSESNGGTHLAVGWAPTLAGAESLRDGFRHRDSLHIVALSNPGKYVLTRRFDVDEDKVVEHHPPQPVPQKELSNDKRSNYLIRTYGIAFHEYKRLFRTQKGRCKICGTKEVGTDETKVTLCLDHCHKTGKVRGLLCSHCNSGLGFFRDDPELMQKAIEYIKTHRGNSPCS